MPTVPITSLPRKAVAEPSSVVPILQAGELRRLTVEQLLAPARPKPGQTTRFALGAVLPPGTVALTGTAQEFDEGTFPELEAIFGMDYVEGTKGQFSNEARTEIGVGPVGSGEAGGIKGAISLSGDGLVMALGSSRGSGRTASDGAVRIFDKVSDDWVLRETVVSPDVQENAEFGSSLALSYDGTTLVVGAPRHYGPDGSTERGSVFRYVHPCQ